MKVAPRRWFGAALIGLAAAAFVLLTWSRFGQGRVLESRTLSDGSWTVTTAMYEVRWPLWLTIVLLATAGVGVLLLVLPRREKPTH
jgi:hypothetical protein